MGTRRTLQELTIKDGFMFAATMMDPENCRLVLERILEMPIAKVEVCKEKSIIYHPEYKGVRLDVFAKDENGTHFDVEMQVATEQLLKRARYYHGQMDAELISTGTSYKELPDGYVIFICDFDPIGLGKFRYTLKKGLKEDNDFAYEDGQHTIFLSTKGKNEDEEPQELVRFLRYVGAGLEESSKNYDDSLVERLQETVRLIKTSREMGERFMTFEELKQMEYEEGLKKGREEGREENQIITTYIASKLREGIDKETLEKEGYKASDIDYVKQLLQL